MISDQMVRVIDDWISKMNTIILNSHLCSPINFLRIVLINSKNNLKKGLLKRHLHTMSFCLDYHSAISTGLSKVSFL